jgi:hypothetical protein
MTTIVATWRQPTFSLNYSCRGHLAAANIFFKLLLPWLPGAAKAYSFI